jgi:glycosyltransferase involved in cell wall biosynthesis
MIRVAHLTTFHNPLDARILHKECRSLADAGYEVHVVAPQLPPAPVDRITFHRIEDAAARGRAGRDAPRFRIFRRLRGAYRAARAVDARVYHCHDPELILLGLPLKLAGRTVVFDAHEDAPREALSLARMIGRRFGGRLRWAVWWALIKAAGPLFDGFVCATGPISRRFPARRTIVVHNYPRLEEFAWADACTGRPPGGLLYLGGVSRIRGVFEMIAALRLVPAELGARLTLVGEIQPPALVPDVRRAAEGLPVNLVGWQDREGVARHLSAAAVGLVLLHPTPEYLESRPVKLFEYMAAGLPVIASDFPPWRRIVEGAGCGLLVDPLDPRAIAAAVCRLLERPAEAREMGRRGREAVRTTYNWEREVPALLGMYRRVTGR